MVWQNLVIILGGAKVYPKFRRQEELYYFPKKKKKSWENKSRKLKTVKNRGKFRDSGRDIVMQKSLSVSYLP